MQDSRHAGSDIALGIGAVVAMVLCCAGPLLVAAGALGWLGAALGHPVVIAAGAALALLAVVGVARRRTAGDTCCPPGASRPDGERARRAP